MSSKLAGGAWVKLVAHKLKLNGSPRNSSDYEAEGTEFAFAQNANWNEDFNVQPLEVLGHLGAVEHNSFGYTCSLNIDTLVAKNKDFFDKFVPNRTTVQIDGVLDNWMITYQSTTGDGEIYAQFLGVVVGTVGQNIATNQYVTQNMSLMSIERVKSGSEV